MRPFRYPLLATTLVLVTSCPALCQTSTAPTRDPQAVALVQKAIAAMGSVPTDSTATGTVTITAGGSSQTGQIEVLTRGVAQSLERLTTPSITSEFVFSGGLASASNGKTRKASSLEWSQTAQSAIFPLPLLVGALQNPDTAFTYIGQENIDGASTFHVQFWDSFASNPQRQWLASLPKKDLWISAGTALPLRISYTQQDGRGPTVPMQRIDTTYEKYQSIGGVMYPLVITKTLNGSPWLTITITQLTFNTGLSDSNFPLQ